MQTQLEKFLQDIAQGVYGKSKLTYSDIHEFFRYASKEDLDELADFFWEFTSALTDEADVVDAIPELEEFIFNTLSNDSPKYR